MTRIQELIKKFDLTLVIHEGAEAIKITPYRKATKKDIEEIRSLKPAIIAELKAQEAKRAEEAARRAAEKEAERKAILSGEKRIKAEWRDGEYMSGWAVYGQEAELLEDIGACKYISGWGYALSPGLVDTLGKEFTYAQAEEFTRAERETRAAAAAKRKAEKEAKFAAARTTGKPVELSRRMEPCNDPYEDCDTDCVIEYAMPDGTIKTVRQHTW